MVAQRFEGETVEIYDLIRCVDEMQQFSSLRYRSLLRTEKTATWGWVRASDKATICRLLEAMFRCRQ